MVTSGSMDTTADTLQNNVNRVGSMNYSRVVVGKAERYSKNPAQNVSPDHFAEVGNMVELIKEESMIKKT